MMQIRRGNNKFTSIDYIYTILYIIYYITYSITPNFLATKRLCSSHQGNNKICHSILKLLFIEYYLKIIYARIGQYEDTAV